jgi:NADH:ubiquinone oxidoreductase subunit
MTIGTKIYTWLNGELVGEDEFGNRYFRHTREDAHGIHKRWVMYKGYPEPSKVPAHWHKWLHYTSDELPQNSESSRYKWQKPHSANLSGTPMAYVPQGHILRGGVRAPSESDYTAWQPATETKSKQAPSPLHAVKDSAKTPSKTAPNKKASAKPTQKSVKKTKAKS